MAAAAEEPLLGDEGDLIDERFEYDAPRFYDFDEGSPAGAPAADGWFDTDGPKGLVTPLKPAATPQDLQPAKGAVTGAAEHDSQQQQQAEASTKTGGKGKGGEWRRALASITNTKSQQQQPAAAAPAGKRKAAGAAGGGSKAPASAGGSRSRPASAAAGGSKKHTSQHGHASQQKTSEQLELDRVQREKEEAAALRRRNAAAVKQVLAPPPPAVAHSSKPLTEPVGLELNTSKRRRMHSMDTRSMVASPFKSMAEQIAAYEGRMPSKSRLGDRAGSSAAADAREAAPRPHVHHGAHGALTVPHSPRFATKQRVRPPRFKPREVVEAEEMAAMPRFKARPVNKRIMAGRSQQLPHVDAKPPMVPAPFALKTDQRAADHHGGGDMFVFAAHGDAGRVTRSRAASKVAAPSGAWTGHITQPAPFHLATVARGATKRSAAAEPQQEQQEARPAKRARKTTAGPFHLATDTRGSAEQARLEGMRRRQEEVAREEAEFKALPLNKAALAGAWHPPPQPVVALTVPQEVQLRSDVRAAQRRQFDEAVVAKEAQLEAERAELQRLQAEAEEEETRAHRRRLGHKPLPLPGRL